MREGRPFVVLKAATSLDGRIAEAPGRRTRLTSAAANRHAHAVRAEVDAIGVGSGTILADDPLLTARGAYRERPLTRVVFDRRLRTPPTARVLSTREAGPCHHRDNGRRRRRAPIGGGRSRSAGPRSRWPPTRRSGAALERLGSRSIESLLLEGGAAVHAAAWDEGLVDFVRLYVTPHVLGPGRRAVSRRAARFRRRR